MKQACRNLLWALVPSLCVVACGGGGGGSGSTSPPPSGSTPQPNRPPVIAAANGEQVAIIGFAYDYDVTKAGDVFSDPDGDTLTYEANIAPNSIDQCDLDLTDLRVTGVPNVHGGCDVTLIARDGRGAEATDFFTIRTRKNQPPNVAQPNPNMDGGPNAAIDYDASQDGLTFADADGHVLSYEVTILSAPPGFSVQGTRIAGMLTGPGFAKVKIEARAEEHRGVRPVHARRAVRDPSSSHRALRLRR